MKKDQKVIKQNQEHQLWGGIMIVGGITIATLIFADFTIEVALALFVMLGHFVLGFLDDYIKVVLKRNLGLKAKQKITRTIYYCNYCNLYWYKL